MSKEMRSLLNNKFQCNGSNATCYYEMKCLLRLVHPNISGSPTGKSIKEKYCCTGYVSFVIILCLLNSFLFYRMVPMSLEKNRKSFN